MDVRERFQNVVVPSYEEFARSPTKYHLLESALLSMNSVAEYLGLERRGYPPEFSRNERRREAQKIRDGFSDLADLQVSADTLKHARNNRDQGVTLSSTGIDPHDRTTWYINGKHLPDVAHKAFTALKEIPEIT